MKNAILIIFLKTINKILNIFGKQGGNVIGKIAKKINPNILKSFKVNCPVIAVTATNGKTSTNNCISYTLEQAGYKVISNKEGNNMETGIISTLIKNCKINGEIKADYITFEVDESYVPKIFKIFRLDTLVILDFFRDQLDRNGEVETLILKIQEFLKTYKGNLVLNHDDPNVARLGKANKEAKVYYYHAEPYENATKEMKEAGEGKFCPFCKTRLEYEYYQYSHIGKFKCPKCQYGTEENYKIAKKIDLKERTFEVEGIKYKVQDNSIYTIYNYIAVLTIMDIYHIDIESVKKSFLTFQLNNGRLEKLQIKGIPTIINLAKNPTGANVSLRILKEDNEEKELLFVLNDNIADGFDVSWIWDINFDELSKYKVSKVITAGKRAYDIAIRIKTSGFDADKIKPYLNLEDAVKELYKTNIKKYVIANYTALQPTRHGIIKYK